MTTLQAILIGGFPFVALSCVVVLLYIYRDRLSKEAMRSEKDQEKDS